MCERPWASCSRFQGLELTADPESPRWQPFAPVWLSEASTGATPEQRTAVRVAWTSSELRLLFDVEDSHVWATLLSRGDPLYTEEVVEVFFDPVGDLESYFEIELNPLNTVLDLVLRKTRSGYRKDFSWRCEGFRSEVRLSERGWVAEMGIPFLSVMAQPPQPGDIWRVNFSRIDRPQHRERELSAWSAPLRPSFHTPECFGFLEFADIQP
jgi:hypothetical protein